LGDEGGEEGFEDINDYFSDDFLDNIAKSYESKFSSIFNLVLFGNKGEKGIFGGRENLEEFLRVFHHLQNILFYQRLVGMEKVSSETISTRRFSFRNLQDNLFDFLLRYLYD